MEIIGVFKLFHAELLGFALWRPVAKHELLNFPAQLKPGQGQEPPVLEHASTAPWKNNYQKVQCNWFKFVFCSLISWIKALKRKANFNILQNWWVQHCCLSVHSNKVALKQATIFIDRWCSGHYVLYCKRPAYCIDSQCGPDIPFNKFTLLNLQMMRSQPVFYLCAEPFHIFLRNTCIILPVINSSPLLFMNTDHISYPFKLKYHISCNGAQWLLHYDKRCLFPVSFSTVNYILPSF